MSTSAGLVMGDENLYLQVDRELESGIKDEALWAKARGLSKGDDKENTHKYIELKVQSLKDTIRAQKNRELRKIRAQKEEELWERWRARGKAARKAILWGGGIFVVLFLIAIVSALSQL